MPVLTGLEMFEKLQQETEAMNIPLIFLSAKAEKEDIRAGMNLGAEDYLTKPIDVTDLLNSVENKIKKKLIREQKNIRNSKEFLNIIENQKSQLKNYFNLVLEKLKPSPTKISVSNLLAWTQKELEKNNNFVDASILINEKWRTSGPIESTLINMNTIVDRVIDRMNETPNVTISKKNVLPTLLANEVLLEKVFEVLIQKALAAPNSITIGE
jgi:YesN/AraC family two-component response regulator